MVLFQSRRLHVQRTALEHGKRGIKPKQKPQN